MKPEQTPWSPVLSWKPLLSAQWRWNQADPCWTSRNLISTLYHSFIILLINPYLITPQPHTEPSQTANRSVLRACRSVTFYTFESWMVIGFVHQRFHICHHSKYDLFSALITLWSTMTTMFNSVIKCVFHLISQILPCPRQTLSCVILYSAVLYSIVNDYNICQK